MFDAHHGLDAVALNGKDNSLLVTEDSSKAKLPAKAMTAEAWVRIDATQEWGGLIGAIQDNGSYERGWLLGFRQRKFSLALAGKEGPGRLTYLNADADFTLGNWHHVVGTYDGATMRLYVDGKLSAESEEQRGEINYPPRTFYELGAYHDDNEHYPTTGLMHEVRVYDRVLSDEEVAKHFAAKTIVEPKFVQLVAGPRIQFDSSTSAVVQWETERPSTTKLILTDDIGEQRRL